MHLYISCWCDKGVICNIATVVSKIIRDCNLLEQDAFQTLKVGTMAN